MSFKDHLQKASDELDDKLLRKVCQIEAMVEKISQLEDQLTELYEHLEDLEKEKINLNNLIKEQG